MEIVTIDHLQKYSTFFHDTSILTRVIIPKPTDDTNIIVLSKIFTITKGYKLCTVCLISSYTNDIVIEAYKIHEEITIPYMGGIELCDFGEVDLKPGYSYIIHLDEVKYIPLLVLYPMQVPTIELVEHAMLSFTTSSNLGNKTTFIKQVFRAWLIVTLIFSCGYFILFTTIM